MGFFAKFTKSKPFKSSQQDTKALKRFGDVQIVKPTNSHADAHHAHPRRRDTAGAVPRIWEDCGSLNKTKAPVKAPSVRYSRSSVPRIWETGGASGLASAGTTTKVATTYSQTAVPLLWD